MQGDPIVSLPGACGTDRRQDADGMRTADGRKRQRAVMATDSDWQTLKERADAAGMDVSRFIVERLTAPEDPAARRDLAGAVARIERALRVLYEVEKQRVADTAGADTWQALVRRHDHALMAKHLERTCQVRNRVRQSRPLGSVRGGAQQCLRLLGQTIADMAGRVDSPLRNICRENSLGFGTNLPTRHRCASPGVRDERCSSCGLRPVGYPGMARSLPARAPIFMLRGGRPPGHDRSLP